MDKTKLTLQKNMKELRKERDWRQEDLAEASGYSVGFIADIERGKSWVSPESLEAIREAFNVPLERLFRTGEPEKPLEMPVSKTLQKMMRIPDSVYDLVATEHIDDNGWAMIEGAIEGVIDEIRDRKGKIKSNGD